MSQPLIDLQHISKSFDGEMVLDDLNLSIKENSFVTLLGPSGCGKSTTLRILGGFTPPDKGNVIFDGQDITKLPPNKRQLNTVFQKYALFPHMNVYENISVGLRARIVKDVDIVAQKVMKQFQISELASRYPKQLSGGQKQRVALARLMAYEPDVLLLDEPFSALDEDLKEDLLRELKSELQISKPVIFVSHNKEEVNELCDFKYKIKQGEIV